TGARAGAWISVRVVPVPHGRPQRRRVDLQQLGDVRLPVRTWRAQTSLPPGYEIPVEGGGAGDGIELFGEAGLRPSPLDPESRQHVTDNLTQRDLLDVLGKGVVADRWQPAEGRGHDPMDEGWRTLAGHPPKERRRGRSSAPTGLNPCPAND